MTYLQFILYFPLLIAFLGLILFVYGLIYTIENIMSKKWPKTKATILNSNLEKIDNKNQQTKKIFPYNFVCNIKYKYKTTKTNELFTNNKITLRGSLQNSYKAKKICNHLAVGKIIDVYYNPKNPRKSYLVYQPNFPFFIMMFIGIFIYIFSIILFFDFRHKDLESILNLIQIIP